VHPVAVQLDERASVEQELDALAGRQLAAFALPLDGLLGGRVGRRLTQVPQPLYLACCGILPESFILHGQAF
jgi:phage gp36-like protein